MRPFIAAAIQIAPRPYDVEKNCARAVEWLEKAVRQKGAELVVFPESMSTGYLMSATRERVYEAVDVIPGRTTKAMQEAARDLGVHVVWPTYERGPSPDVLYNSSVLIDDGGQVVGVYRKTHPFAAEKLVVTAGTQVEVFPTRLGRIGMIVCYDGDFPELSRVLAVKGAEVVTRASALLRPFDIWDLTNRARAFDNHVFVVAANAVGPEAEGIAFFYGHSMIVGPTAQRLALAGAGEEIVAARLDPDPAAHFGHGGAWPDRFHHMRDRNLAAYKDLLLEPAEQDAPREPAQQVLG